MNSGEIRIGIIGFGRMAKVYHLPSLRKVPGARVVAVADTRADLRDEARKLGIDHFFEDYHEMYKKVDLDLVMICSPPQVHREPTILAGEKGIPVSCEKPVAPSRFSIRTFRALPRSGQDKQAEGERAANGRA